MNLLIVLDCCKELLLCVLHICVLANVAKVVPSKIASCKILENVLRKGVKHYTQNPSQFFILNIRFIGTQRLVVFSAFIFCKSNSEIINFWHLHGATKSACQLAVQKRVELLRFCKRFCLHSSANLQRQKCK